MSDQISNEDLLKEVKEKLAELQIMLSNFENDENPKLHSDLTVTKQKVEEILLIVNDPDNEDYYSSDDYYSSSC